MHGSSRSLKSAWDFTDIHFAVHQRQLVQSVHPAVSSRIEECLCLWKDEMVFVYTCLYVMSRFKSVFAGLTTMLCKLSLELSFLYICPSTFSHFLNWCHYVRSLVEMALVFACSPCSICLPGSWCICYKQEQACTTPLCPTAGPVWPKKSQTLLI